jgi:hypothetical protein
MYRFSQTRIKIFRKVKMNSEILKPKKVMTEAMLANLALAREKAKAKRLQIGELTRLKKEVVEKKQVDEISSLRKVLNSSPVDDADDDEPTPPPPIKKSKVPKQPIIIIEDSESEDEQVFYVKRKSRFAPVPAPPQVPVVVAPIPETPKVPVSIYAGMHPSMLSGRRRY